MSSHAEVVTLYQITAVLSQGELKVIEDTFDAEVRGKVYKTVKTENSPRSRVKYIVKIKIGEILERPLPVASPTSMGFHIVYSNPDERDALVKQLVTTIKKRLQQYHNDMLDAFVEVRCFEKAL